MGPLQGFTVIEMAGIGPAPFAAMLLADMGANVIRVDRAVTGQTEANSFGIMNRGKKSIAVNLKSAEGINVVMKLLESADAIIEGFRPGVMERLGLGPDECLARNPKLVYGRMTGWGQDGPLSHAAGHDINYIAITGALDAMGRKDSGPVPPLNLVGDFGGGSMYLIMGLLGALLETSRSGQGQVIDCAITDGVISLMGMTQEFKGMGLWETGQRYSNMLDGGAHYYDTYECSDGKWISIGSIEPQFYALLCELTGVDLGEPGYATQFNKADWPVYKERLIAAFKTKTSHEWCELMEGTDVCFAPVLDMDEAVTHSHNVARQSFVNIDGVDQTAPAPRFSRTQSSIEGKPPAAGRDTQTVLRDVGFSEQEVDELLAAGAVTGIERAELEQ